MTGTVRWHVQNPSIVQEPTADVRVRVDGIQLASTSALEVTVNAQAFGLNFHVEAENHVARVIGPVEGRLGLLYPREFDSIGRIENWGTTDVVVDETSRLCIVGQPLELRPGQWWSLTIPVTRSGRYFESNEEIPFVIRLLRSSGVRDLPFTGRIKHKSPPTP